MCVMFNELVQRLMETVVTPKGEQFVCLKPMYWKTELDTDEFAEMVDSIDDWVDSINKVGKYSLKKKNLFPACQTSFSPFSLVPSFLRQVFTK